MLSQRFGNLRITQKEHEGKPLLILEGYCDKDSANFLYQTLISFLKDGHKFLIIDTKNLQHSDLKGNMAISSANREFVKRDGKLIILSNSQPVSKAMKIMRNNRFAAH